MRMTRQQLRQLHAANRMPPHHQLSRAQLAWVYGLTSYWLWAPKDMDCWHLACIKSALHNPLCRERIYAGVRRDYPQLRARLAEAERLGGDNMTPR